MKIAVDIDEVLCQFMNSFFKFYNHRHNTNWAFDDITAYPNWSVFMGVSSEHLMEEITKFQGTDAFRNMALVKGAREGILELNKTHELYAVTGRPYVVEKKTHEWLDRHFPGVFKAVKLTNNFPDDDTPTLCKGDICQDLGCVVLIDDEMRHVEPIFNRGIKLILFNKPWNSYLQMPPQVERCDNWEEIVQAIDKVAKQNV